MTQLMKTVLALSLSGTVLAAGLALLRRLLKNRLPQGLFYYLWLLVLLRMIVPVALPVPGLDLALPQQTVAESVIPPAVQAAPGAVGEHTVIGPTEVQILPQPAIITGTGLELSVQQAQAPWYEPMWEWLCANFAVLWLVGAAICFFWFTLCYFRYCRRLKRDCAPLAEHEQALFDDLRGGLRVEICRSPQAPTPMLLGLLRPRIVLPDTPISTLQLECILRHELTHLRRWDLWYKWFTVAVTSLHWFNPLMPWLRREISRCCELSCDEAVIEPMGEEWKRTYGETLLALAAANALPRAVPATTLCEEKKQLRERLMGILKHRRATALIVLLSCLLAVAVAGCAAVLGPGASGRDLPEAADYDRWIRMPQKEIFVRNWKAEYHDGAEVASVHLAPEDYEGDEYPFRGRDLPELRARVEAWAFTELPVDRENCTLYYQTEPELLMAQFAKVTAFPVDGGQPGELPLSQLDMDTYCGHVTVTDLRDGSQWVAVITDADRVITLSEPVEPLTEAQLEPILSDLREWAAVNLPEVAEPILTYSPAREEWHRMGMLTDISTCHLYDLERGEVRPVDASYPDVAELGRILLTNEAKSPGVVHTFYLTRGLWREEADPIEELRWLAEGYPDGLVSDLTWIQKEGEGLWLSVYFTENGTSYCFEYSSVNGLSGVRAQGNAREPAVPVTGLPTLMEAVAANQQTAGPDFILALSTDPDTARILMEAHSSLLAVDLSTGTLTEVEGAYTGTLEYGCISVLGAPDAPKPLYLIDGTAGKAAAPAADLTGQVAVLTEDAPLDNAFVQTVDTEGRTVVMDMAVTLKKGDLVYVEGQQGQTCTVTVLSGEPPRPRGQLDETVLATDIGSLQAANQVILKDAPRWAGTNENLSAGPAVSGIANVEERKEGWYRVTLPGGGDPFWVRREDVAFLWPFYPAGKAFVYEKEGFGSEFTISLHADGTFGYYEGMLSSHIGMGSWTVEDGVLTLREDTFQRTFRFRVQEGELRFLREGSDRFSYIKVADGDRFLENTAASAAPVS